MRHKSGSASRSGRGVRAVAVLTVAGCLAAMSAAVPAVAAAGEPVRQPSTTAAPTGTASYAPLDQPGPPLTVPPAQLAASLTCTPTVAHASRAPVLLVPGTTLTPDLNFAWNVERAFALSGQAWCAVTLPLHAMGDAQIAGEYVVNAIRQMRQSAGRTIDILGYSQGGMLPRWALRFWPDTRAMVNDLVALDPSNHGTLDAYATCLLSCAPALWQQRTGSHFLQALNSGAETFAGIAYTNVYSLTDEIVVPNLGPAPSSALTTGAGAIRNVAVQSICPLDLDEHVAMGTYDPVGYALAVDAFNHAGPADPARINRGVCSTLAEPGVSLAALPVHLAQVALTAAQQLLVAAQVTHEPALRSYVYGS